MKLVIGIYMYVYIYIFIYLFVLPLDSGIFPTAIFTDSNRARDPVSSPI